MSDFLIVKRILLCSSYRKILQPTDNGKLAGKLMHLLGQSNVRFVRRREEAGPGEANWGLTHGYRVLYGEAYAS
jgi:hypothetical protein